MATIAALLGSRLNELSRAVPELPNVGNIGIELELEGLTRWPEVRGWRTESDGSLRDGIEYVFDGPQSGTTALRSIQSMAQALAETPPEPSFRCSTHIHIDVRDMELEKLELMVLAYVMTEGVMFDHCAPERRYSNFCPPFFVNTQLARQFTQLFHQAGSDTRRFSNCNAWPKYSAFNIKPIVQYGSVEFRGSHALTTEAELLGLAQRALHLKRVAMTYDAEPIEFVSRLRNLTLSEIFPTGLAEGYAPDEALMDQCYATALGIASGRLMPLRQMNGNPFAQPEMAIPRPAYQDVPLSMNGSVMESYGLFPVRTMRLSAYLRMLVTVRRAMGRQRPGIFTFINERHRGDYGVFGGGGNLIAACRELGIHTGAVGL